MLCHKNSSSFWIGKRSNGVITNTKLTFQTINSIFKHLFPTIVAAAILNLRYNLKICLLFKEVVRIQRVNYYRLKTNIYLKNKRIGLKKTMRNPS